MGGGDLNLKKSWHPSTLRNIERVWKAEQKHEVEKQKIEQLQKELAEERAREEIQAYAEDQGVVKKRSERLDWMYQGPAALVNREEYLMGRKVDKTLELLEQQETGVESKKDDFDIGTSMFSSQDLSGTATVDLANKIREDPLFSIMKKEKEQRKNLLCNPVKMKQLQQMLQASLGKEKKKKSRKHEEEKKLHKKHKHCKSYSSPDDRRPSKNVSKSKQDSSPEDRYRRKSSSGHYKAKHSESSSHRVGKDSTKNENDSSRQSCNRKSHSSESESKRKLNDKERERRLMEMQDNARWREEQRVRNVKRYKEEDEKEDNVDFRKSMFSKAAGNESLENRVKQKIFSIQRNSADMEKHFARR